MAQWCDGSLRLSLLPVQFEVSDDNESLQMLTRNSQIGEFYVMSPPQIDIEPFKGKHTCDMMIYDEERDQHVRIQWEQAFKATLLKDDAFTTKTAMDTEMSVGNTSEIKTLALWKEECEAWIQFNDGKEVTANNGILNKDVRIVVARPFIEHTMHNVIMTVSGRDTGATLFGPADMQLSVSFIFSLKPSRIPPTHTPLTTCSLFPGRPTPKSRRLRGAFFSNSNTTCR